MFAGAACASAVAMAGARIGAVTERNAVRCRERAEYNDASVVFLGSCGDIQNRCDSNDKWFP